MILNISPISINKAFKGRRFRTLEHKKYVKDLLILLKRYKGIKPKNNYRIEIIFYFKNNLSDLSNYVKIFEDCIVKSKIVKDDRYCMEMLLIKKIDKKNERIEFKIEEIN